MSEHIVSGSMPVMALRGLTVFPDQTVHFDVGRFKSTLALEDAMKHDQTMLLLPQKSVVDDDPGFEDLYPIGTVVKIKQILKPQGENLRVLVTGQCRGRVVAAKQTSPFLSGIVESVPEIAFNDNLKVQALRREANLLYAAYLDMAEHPAQSVQLRMIDSDDTGFIADSIAQNSGMDYADKAKLLCQLHPVKRLEEAVRLLRREVEMSRLEGYIQDRTKANIDQNQKDYYLREQMRAIREELGEGDDDSEFENYEKKIRELQLSEESQEKLLTDVKRLKKQPFGSSEASVLRNYLDVVLELPWNVTTKERVDVEAARKILDHDHFGMEKV